jgi:hypothetical protein
MGCDLGGGGKVVYNFQACKKMPLPTTSFVWRGIWSISTYTPDRQTHPLGYDDPGGGKVGMGRDGGGRGALERRFRLRFHPQTGIV